MSRHPSFSMALALGALVSACDGQGLSVSRIQPHIISGSVDTTHQAVVALVTMGQEFCSGTLVAPRAVVSAGHCVVESGLKASEISVFFGDVVGGPGKSIKAKDWQAHPSYYVRADGAPMSDVSVITLAEDGPVPPMAWQSAALPSIVGKSTLMVGYGVTNAWKKTGSGTRRQVSAIITGQDPTFIYYGSGKDGTCGGDSGGPTFLDQGGTPVLVAVTSFGDQSCVQLGANTRVDAFASFITKFLTGCTPSCGGKPCGSDGCGGLCGSCGTGQLCGPTGQCAACTPSCGGKQCGADGCGGQCGSCETGQSCSASGQCAASCTPQCGGKKCGSDGCGGSCGSCGPGKTCSTAGQCVAGCTPNCAGKQCGLDGCGGLCGSCGAGERCDAAGLCVPPTPPVKSQVGAACQSSSECESGLCAEDQGTKQCLQICTGASCPTGFHCGTAAGASVTACLKDQPIRASLGDPCQANGDCTSGICVAGAEGQLFCSELCDPSQGCQGEFDCVAKNQQHLCLPQASAPAAGDTGKAGGGCSLSPVAGSTPAPGAGLLLLLLLVGRSALGRRREASRR